MPFFGGYVSSLEGIFSTSSNSKQTPKKTRPGVHSLSPSDVDLTPRPWPCCENSGHLVVGSYSTAPVMPEVTTNNRKHLLKTSVMAKKNERQCVFGYMCFFGG